MSNAKYGELKTLPIGTDFKRAAPEGGEKAWGAIKDNKDNPFGPLTGAAYMRIKEARQVERSLRRLLRDNRLTPEMADHLRALPLDNVFAVNHFLCAAVAEHVTGKGKNSFVPTDGFQSALEEFGLPLIK